MANERKRKRRHNNEDSNITSQRKGKSRRRRRRSVSSHRKERSSFKPEYFYEDMKHVDWKNLDHRNQDKGICSLWSSILKSILKIIFFIFVFGFIIVSLKPQDNCLENECHPNAYCRSITAGYECGCVTGFVGDGINVCADIDECHPDNREKYCSQHATCSNTMGSYECD